MRCDECRQEGFGHPICPKKVGGFIQEIEKARDEAMATKQYPVSDAMNKLLVSWRGECL